MSKQRYFIADNCNREIASSGIVFTFTQYTVMGGSPRGYYVAKSDEEAEILGVMSKTPGFAVSEISASDYEKISGVVAQRKPASWQTFDSNRPNPVVGNAPPNERIKTTVDRAAIQSATLADEPKPEPVVVQPISDATTALKTGKTEVIVSPPEKQASKAKASTAQHQTKKA